MVILWVKTKHHAAKHKVLLVASKEAGLEDVQHMYQQNEWNNGFIKFISIP